MTNKQNNLFRMFKRVQAFCKRYPNELSGSIQFFSAEEAALDALIINIEKTIILQEHESGGVGDDIDALKLSLAETVYMYSSKGLPLARNAKNNNFVKILNHGIHYIYKASIARAKSRSADIRDCLANPLFTNITPANLAAISAAISAYDTVSMDSVYEIAHKRGSGTEILPAEFSQGRIIVNNMNDFIIGDYYMSNRALVNEFEVTREIADLGTTHTKLISKVIEAVIPKTPIDKVKITIQIGTKTIEGFTDIYGNNTLEKFKDGTYHVLYQKTGYKDKDVIQKFIKGKAVELTIELEKL